MKLNDYMNRSLLDYEFPKFWEKSAAPQNNAKTLTSLMAERRHVVEAIDVDGIVVSWIVAAHHRILACHKSNRNCTVIKE